MQKFILFFILSIGGLKAVSQQQYFIYIQSEEKRPFYARINNKIYSSSENGYMIIPKLGDNTYEITIGFSKNAYPEQQFPVTINKKDNGFQLQNLGEKGWGLTNLQTTAVTLNTRKPATTKPEYGGVRKTDAFSQRLASVVNDSAVLYSSTEAPEPVQEIKENKLPEDVVTIDEKKIVAAVEVIPEPPVTIQEKVQPTENAAAPVTSPVKDEPLERSEPGISVKPDTLQDKKPQPVPGKTAFEKPFITKIAEYRTDEAFEAIYLEQYNFSTDIIRISIPLKDAAGPVITGNSREIPVQDKAPSQEKIPEPVPPAKKADEPEIAAKPATTGKENENPAPVVITNSDCKNFATENDVDKLRVKIMHDNAVDDKYITARKYFRTKCFSVKQIKALTELFPTDETKYRFFDVAYPFVSDSANFHSLVDLIEGNYYKNRFKAMLQQ